jgi:hypothetical protein
LGACGPTFPPVNDLSRVSRESDGLFFFHPFRRASDDPMMLRTTKMQRGSPFKKCIGTLKEFISPLYNTSEVK